MDASTRLTTIKRLTFRSWHRGWQENDLIFGNFANRHLAELSDEELQQYEALLEESDPDIFAWVTSKRPVPEQFDTSLMKRLQAFKI